MKRLLASLRPDRRIAARCQVAITIRATAMCAAPVTAATPTTVRAGNAYYATPSYYGGYYGGGY